jgi:hypothetical protein
MPTKAPSKSIFKSKAFWLNVLGVGQLVIAPLPIDPQTAGLVLAGLNVAVRAITKGPVHVLTDAATEP